MAPDESERRAWRDDGSGPKVGEYILALVLVPFLVVIVLALFGDPTSRILMTHSGTV